VSGIIGSDTGVKDVINYSHGEKRKILFIDKKFGSKNGL
jgi:hypothetical protein